jgi:hypothetical protein
LALIVGGYEREGVAIDIQGLIAVGYGVKQEKTWGLFAHT